MRSIESLAAELGPPGAVEEKCGSLWLTPASVDVRHMAVLMQAEEGRLVTIAARQATAGPDVQLDYHWDLAGRLVSIVTQTQEGQAVSIRDLYPAADWVEREIQEYFAISFQGSEYEPLMLRPGDTSGLLRKEEEDE